MKKIKYLLLLCIFAIVSTGCVKFNATMDINKDKSMDFKIIYAIDTSSFGESDKLKEESFDELKKDGYTITKYSEGTMEGFTISKKINNIDEVSTDKDVVYNLSGLMQSGDGKRYIFKVEKGLLKDTYTAVLKFDTTDSNLNTNTTDDDYAVDEEDLPDEIPQEIADDEDDSILVTGEDDTDDIEITSEGNPTMDYSSLITNMDLSFHVNLPYGAISNNATSTENGNKTLTWSLATSGSSNIEFKFAIYNMTFIYIGIGVLLVVVLLIIFLLTRKKGKKEPVLVNENQVNIKNDVKENVVKGPELKEKANVMEKDKKKNA